MGKSAPPPPDYAAAAEAQGDANKDAAIYNNNANRVNQYGPNGSSVWSTRPGSDPQNPQVGDYSQTTTYSPEQQAIADQNNKLTTALLGTANNQLGKVNDAFNNTTTADTSGAFGWQGAPTPTTTGYGGGYQGSSRNYTEGTGQTVSTPDPRRLAAQDAMINSLMKQAGSGQGVSGQQLLGATAGAYNGGGDPTNGGMNLDPNGPMARYFAGGNGGGAAGAGAGGGMGGAGGSMGGGMGSAASGNPAMTGNLNYGGSDGGTDYNAGRDAVTNALLSRTEPQNQLDMQKLQTQLANQGVTPGSTAYNNAMDVLSRKSTDSRMAATLAGGQEQTRLNDMYRNNTQLGLNVQQQRLGAQQQQFNQGLASAGFNNATHQSQVQEESFYENKDLNNINALRTGNQVQAPQFGSYYTSNSQAAPVFDAATQQGNYDSAANTAKQSGANSTTGAVASLGAAAIAAFAFNSDRRLKRNVRTIGRHPSGVRRVSWDWIDGSGSATGVIAQELRRVRPDAVIERPDGMLAVVYSAIGGF